MIAQHGQEAEPNASTHNLVFDPRSESERNQVREQLSRILASPAFQNSKRYAAVLRYVVDQTLEGYGDRLKERTIGIEVFDRPPDYDTATDHAVRSAAAEVRKRLAQYYLNGSRGELRIDILPGSYIPQFRWGEDDPPHAPLPAQTGAPEADREAAQPLSGRVARRLWARLAWIAAGCAMAAAVVLALVLFAAANDALQGFWKPVFTSRAPILLCIGNVEGGQTAPSNRQGSTSEQTLADFHNSPDTTVDESDAFTLAKFVGLLQANGRKYRFATQSDATFSDMQSGPAILVGLLNNSWTQRLMPKLRFWVDRPAPGRVVIRDRNRPANSDWSVDYSKPYLDLTKDYAIVLRMVDPKTEQTVIAAGGITVFGTSAAGNFLTDRNEMKKLAAVAPRGWEKKNMELVLSTDVIRGQSGPASIVAAQFW
jgi:hypothetical protein